MSQSISTTSRSKKHKNIDHLVPMSKLWTPELRKKAGKSYSEKIVDGMRRGDLRVLQMQQANERKKMLKRAELERRFDERYGALFRGDRSGPKQKKWETNRLQEERNALHNK